MYPPYMEGHGMTLLGTRTAHQKDAAGMIASGDGGDDESETPRILAADSPPVAISGLRETFHVSKFFSAEASHGLLAEIDPDFTEIFGGRIVEARPARQVIRHTLRRLSGFWRIEESFMCRIDTDLHAIADLVLRSNLLERGFGGLDDTPVDSGSAPRKNLFRVDGWWVALAYEKRAWHIMMPDPQEIFKEYTKVFVPYGAVS